MPAQDAMGPQWRMHTNMKAAPNSQGTLFQGGNAQRWPRGYTPERQQQVMSGLHPETREAMRSSPGVRAMVDTLKRSTVRAVDTHDVRYREVVGGGVTKRLSEGLQVGGSYQRGYTLHPETGDLVWHSTVNAIPSEVSRSTVIHELGHHVSQKTGRPSSKYNTVSRKGADEGFAEAFAERNFRDRRGRPDANFSTNPLKWSGGMGSASRAAFEKHFQKEREGTPSRTRELRASASFVARGSQEGLFDVDLSLRGRKSTQGVARAGLAPRLGHA